MSKMIKMITLLDNAHSFYEIAQKHTLNFGWARIVNMSFAVELYIKFVVELETSNKVTGHQIDKLFSNLDFETQDKIFIYWLQINKTNVPNNAVTKKWFYDNLEAYNDVFEKFRYVHEWAGVRVSLMNSWSIKKWEKFSAMSPKREFGTMQPYDNFLYDLAESLITYIKVHSLNKLHSL